MDRQTANNVSGSNDIHDVIFDFCGVLLELNYHPCLDGHFPQETVDALCTDEEDVYGFYEAEGRMDAGENFTDVIKDYQHRHGDDMASMFRFYIEHYGDALPKMVDGMEQLLADLRQASYGVWGLTNWSDETFHFAFEKFPQLQRLLQGTVVSGTEKMHKPDADIFNLTLNRFGLNAKHTAFVDDTQANVDGALDVGITGIRFTSASDTRNELQCLGVRV